MRVCSEIRLYFDILATSLKRDGKSSVYDCVKEGLTVSNTQSFGVCAVFLHAQWGEKTVFFH
jgi:hypothetical protein